MSKIQILVFSHTHFMVNINFRNKGQQYYYMISNMEESKNKTRSIFLWSTLYPFPYDIKFNTVSWAWENVVPNIWLLVYTYNVISKKIFLPFLHRPVKCLFLNLPVTSAAQTCLSKRGKKPTKTKNLLIYICHPKNFPYKVSTPNLITSLL